jgi:integrase
MKRLLRLVQQKTWQGYLEDFILEKRLAGCRERTIKDYTYHITRFFASFRGSLEDLDALKKRLQEYLSPDLAPATFNTRRKCLKAFFSYLVSQGAIPANPVAFKALREEGRARAVPVEIMQKLLELPDKKTFAGLRNYVLILFTLDTGVRPGEALRLRVEDFNLEAAEVVVRPGVAKTKTSRTLPLSAVTVCWLKKLLSVRPPGAQTVFCNEYGRPLREDSWARILRVYSRKLGYKITPYDLRHSFALYSLRQGMSPFALQRILGHRDLAMTKRYLALTQRDVREEHNKASPVELVVKKRVRKIETQ